MSASAIPAVRNQAELALALFTVGRPQDALNALNTATECTPDFYTLRGEIQFALGRFHEAAGSYFTVVALEPQNILAQFNLGVCMQRLSRWTDAAQAFEKVLDIDGGHDEARLGLGACLVHLERNEDALANFGACCSEATSQRALFGRAVALQFLHRQEASEAAYRQLLETDLREDVLTNLVALSTELEDWGAVQHYASLLLELSPRSVPALQGLASVALGRRDFAAAVQHCGRIVELVPECIEAWHNLRFATDQVMASLQRRAVTQPSSNAKK